MTSSENVALHPTLKARARWLDLPNVEVPHPENQGQLVAAKVSEETLHRLYRANRKTAIWQAWAHLVGTFPPIPGIPAISTNLASGGFSTPRLATACFRGIKRPHRSEETGDSVVVYVLNPTQTLSWDSSMACCAKVTKAPSGTVMAVYMRMQDSLHPPIDDIFGIITGWEFIPCDASVVTLPVDFSERYGEELWR